MRTLITFLFVAAACVFTNSSYAQSITITATHDTICSGSPVTFAAVAAGTGTPHYQWLRNSVHVGVDSTGYTTSTLSNGDVIMCILSSTPGGASIALSAPIVMTVYHTPVVAAISGATTVCRFLTTTLSDDTTGGVWGSSNPLIASVSAAGVVTGSAVGTTTISYVLTNYCGTAAASLIMTVHTTPDVAGIIGSHTLCIAAGAVAFTDSTAGGTWASSNTAVATVSASGAVTPVALGTANISYSLSNTCGTTNRTFNIVVSTAPTAAPITGTLTICQADTAHLHDIAPGGLWSSSNPSLALISVSGGGGGGGTYGLLAGISPGTATISYAVTNPCGSYTNTATVTVNPLPVVYPISIPGTDSLCPGSSVTLTDAASGGVWSSSDISLANVTGGGLVTGVLAGMVNISYSVTNSCGTTTQTQPLYIYCSSTAGVGDINNSVNQMIFPNPAHDLIHIAGFVPASIHVVNMYGQVVMEKRNTDSVSIAELPTGVYFVALYNENGTLVSNQRMIKL